MKTQFAYAVIEDVDKDTDKFVGDDFRYWKLYMADDNWDGRNDYTDDQLRFIINKAHEHGKVVDVHCTGNNEGLRRMLAFDIDTLEHPFYGSALIQTDIVEVTDARCAKVKGIVHVRPPACRAGPKCRPAKPGRSGRRESHQRPIGRN